MNDLTEHTISFEHRDTTISLMGQRDGMYLRRLVQLSRKDIAPLVLDLTITGYVLPITTPAELCSALNATIGYWEKKGVLDGLIKRDVKRFIKNKNYREAEYKEKIALFNEMNTKPYERIRGIRVTNDKTTINFSGRTGVKIKITFSVKGRHYKTYLVVTDGPRTKNCVRHNKLMNCNSLINQVNDWIDVEPVTPGDWIAVENKPFIRHFLIEHKSALNDLISNLNDN